MWFPYVALGLPGSWATISAPPKCNEVHVVKTVPSRWHSAPGLGKCVLLTVSALQKHGACIFDRCLETPRQKSKTETTHLPPNINNRNSRSLVEEQLLFCKAYHVSSRAEMNLSCLPNLKGRSQPQRAGFAAGLLLIMARLCCGPAVIASSPRPAPSFPGHFTSLRNGDNDPLLPPRLGAGIT